MASAPVLISSPTINSSSTAAPPSHSSDVPGGAQQAVDVAIEFALTNTSRATPAVGEEQLTLVTGGLLGDRGVSSTTQRVVEEEVPTDGMPLLAGSGDRDASDDGSRGVEVGQCHAEPLSWFDEGRQGAVFKAAIALLGAAAVVLTLVAVAVLPNGFADIVTFCSKSGIAAAFSLIFVSEIGDKTFFIAALLAMRHSKLLVTVAATAALAVMTVISTGLGYLFKEVPHSITTSAPIGEYAAVALLIYFGVRTLMQGLAMNPKAPKAQEEEDSELQDAEEVVAKAEDALRGKPSVLAVMAEVFTLVFVAEWGDRSMLATIALAATQSPWGVAAGAIAGHLLATTIAVIGGAVLSKHISERVVSIVGGVIFLVFAVATLVGIVFS